MPKIKNVSPFGDLDVPLLGRVVESGSITEVTDEQARVLLMQEDNWKPWGEPARKAKTRARKAEAKAEAAADPAIETEVQQTEGDTE